MKKDKIGFYSKRVLKALQKTEIDGIVDLFTFKERCLKNKVVASRRKFDAAIDALRQSGLVTVKDKTIESIYAEKNRQNIRMQQAHEKSEREIVEEKLFGSETSFDKGNLVLGKVMKSNHDELVFIPNDRRRFKRNIIILNDRKTLSKFQDKICTLKVTVDENENSSAFGILEEIKGDAGNPIAEYASIAEHHGANMTWSDAKVLNEIKKIPDEVNLSKFTLTDELGNVLSGDGKEEIVDLRNLAFSTTDPKDCKDMDDAIYSTFDEDGNLVVYTAVANVTKYVNLKSEIGQRYLRGGFTIYAPNKAYSILPAELSTNICSLNPNVDRLALVIKTTVNVVTGRPMHTEIMDAVIQSKEKYSYEGAQQICDEHPEMTLSVLKRKIKNGEKLTKDEQVVMNSHASDILWKNFKGRNLLEFNTNNEYDITFNDRLDEILDIKQQPHIKYHKVIEAFMLTANEACAKFCLENNLPNIYRVHDEPKETKIEQAFEFFDYMGILFNGELSPKSIKKILESVKGTNYEKVVNNFLVRMQSKAKYSDSPFGFEDENEYWHHKSPNRKNESMCKNTTLALKYGRMDGKEFHSISHFGLQSECYSHSTSPIRRITDYVTHYQILAFKHGKHLLSEDYIKDISQWANMMEKENDLAEREFQELNSALYCENHIGDVMKGYICYFDKRLITNGTVDDFMVIVENEDKGIRVQIPASEILESKGIKVKDVGLSPYGSALINRKTKTPLLKLCTKVQFKITSADRMTRQVFATTDLQHSKSHTNDFDEILKVKNLSQSNTANLFDLKNEDYNYIDNNFEGSKPEKRRNLDNKVSQTKKENLKKKENNKIKHSKIEREISKTELRLKKIKNVKLSFFENVEADDSLDAEEENENFDFSKTTY